MIAYWKEHPSLRVALIAALFVGGFALMICGWRMTGSLTGLGIMLVGVAALLGALWLYNVVFTDPKKKKSK